jgi:hypothetical protein
LMSLLADEHEHATHSSTCNRHSNDAAVPAPYLTRLGAQTYATTYAYPFENRPLPRLCENAKPAGFSGVALRFPNRRHAYTERSEGASSWSNTASLRFHTGSARSRLPTRLARQWHLCDCIVGIARITCNSNANLFAASIIVKIYALSFFY